MSPEDRRKMHEAYTRSLSAPTVEAPAEPVATWINRQVAKILAMVAALGGGAMDPGEGRTFAWFVALLSFALEIYQSRRAEKARVATEQTLAKNIVISRHE